MAWRFLGRGVSFVLSLFTFSGAFWITRDGCDAVALGGVYRHATSSCRRPQMWGWLHVPLVLVIAAASFQRIVCVFVGLVFIASECGLSGVQRRPLPWSMFAVGSSSCGPSTT